MPRGHTSKRKKPFPASSTTPISQAVKMIAEPIAQRRRRHWSPGSARIPT
jgi:hypothetical protein